MITKRVIQRLVIVSLSAVFFACDAADTKLAASGSYQASVKRTSYGVAHITAPDIGSLGYGEGYAAAQDHICNIAHVLVEAKGELASFHGAGDNNKHLVSDLAIRALDIPDKGREAYAEQSAENQQWFIGYAAGYNRYLKDTGRDGITSWCRGAPWVREISAEDLMIRMVALTQTLPRIAPAIANAKPPMSGTGELGAVMASSKMLAQAEQGLSMQGMGSNGWALGEQRTENGRGMLLANPHYPWTGPNRFWEKHLTIPGEMNLYGVHLLGAPGVAIGFNENVGWTHTVSDSQRVVFYQLQLSPDNPTRYRYDKEWRDMTAHSIAVVVKGENEELATQDHTVWFSHYGPIITLGGMKWTDSEAFAARDANTDNYHAASQWKAMGLATDMTAFMQAHKQYNAMPWVNTIATSADGQAVYLDNSNVGNLSEEAIALWQEQIGKEGLSKRLYDQRGMVLLDGSDSRFEWQLDPESVIPGVVPYRSKPQLLRNDYVFNANDSYWLTHADKPISGFSPLYGKTETARSPRTRMNALLLDKESPYGFAGEDDKFSLQEIQQALFSNRSLTAELLLPGLLSACEGATEVTVAKTGVNLERACEVLANFNGRMDIDSAGAVLFREWITRYDYKALLHQGGLFATPFDIDNPVNTPRDLADADMARVKLGEAVTVMQEASLPLDSKLGDVQIAYFSGAKLPVHGGIGHEGIANLMVPGTDDPLSFPLAAQQYSNSTFLTNKGYPAVHGSSFILTLSYTDQGPDAQALLTYSQSGDPSSPHYTDQTRLFANKQWRPVLFTDDEISADTVSTVELVAPRN